MRKQLKPSVGLRKFRIVRAGVPNVVIEAASNFEAAQAYCIKHLSGHQLIPSGTPCRHHWELKYELHHKASNTAELIYVRDITYEV